MEVGDARDETADVNDTLLATVGRQAFRLVAPKCPGEFIRDHR